MYLKLSPLLLRCTVVAVYSLLLLLSNPISENTTVLWRNSTTTTELLYLGSGGANKEMLFLVAAATTPTDTATWLSRSASWTKSATATPAETSSETSSLTATPAATNTPPTPTSKKTPTSSFTSTKAETSTLEQLPTKTSLTPEETSSVVSTETKLTRTTTTTHTSFISPSTVPTRTPLALRTVTVPLPASKTVTPSVADLTTAAPLFVKAQSVSDGEWISAVVGVVIALVVLLVFILIIHFSTKTRAPRLTGKGGGTRWGDHSNDGVPPPGAAEYAAVEIALEDDSERLGGGGHLQGGPDSSLVEMSGGDSGGAPNRLNAPRQPTELVSASATPSTPAPRTAVGGQSIDRLVLNNYDAGGSSPTTTPTATSTSAAAVEYHRGGGDVYEDEFD